MADPSQEPLCLRLSAEESDAIFFPGTGGKSKRAEKFCAPCPVRTQCLENAMVNNLDGFYAGYTKGMRAEILKFKNEVLHETIVKKMLDEEFSMVDEFVGIVRAKPGVDKNGRRIRPSKEYTQYGYLDEIEPSEDELKKLA